MVADALSRCVDVIELDIIDENQIELDEKYMILRNNILENPGNFPNYVVEHGRIFRHCVDRDKNGCSETNRKIYVPEKDRVSILNKYHDSPLGAHLGVFKTLKRIKLYYYWPKMSKDIKNYIRSCEKCQLHKHTNNRTKVPMGVQKETNQPWDCIALDFIEPLPRSNRGNKYFFVVVDVVSKFCILKPMREATAKSVIEFLESNIFLLYGVPSIVIADNGSQFVSKQFKSFCHLYNSKIHYNAAYHPQHNPSERLNRVIMSSARCYIDIDQRNWDTEIDKIACPIRNSPHESVGYTPYFINFGKHINLEVSIDCYSPNLVLSNQEIA